MRQQRISKRHQRHRHGGGGQPPEDTPCVPVRPDSARRVIEKSDELLHRIDRVAG